MLLCKFDAERSLASQDANVGVGRSEARVTDQHGAVDPDGCEQHLNVDRAKTERQVPESEAIDRGL